LMGRGGGGSSHLYRKRGDHTSYASSEAFRDAQCCFTAGRVAAPSGIGGAQDKIDPSLRRVPQ
jgi:hypothetical protein